MNRLAIVLNTDILPLTVWKLTEVPQKSDKIITLQTSGRIITTIPFIRYDNMHNYSSLQLIMLNELLDVYDCPCNKRLSLCQAQWSQFL